MTQNDEFYLEEQRFPKSKQKNTIHPRRSATKRFAGSVAIFSF